MLDSEGTCPEEYGLEGVGGQIHAHLWAGEYATPSFVTVPQTGQWIRTLLVTRQLPT